MSISLALHLCQFYPIIFEAARLNYMQLTRWRGTWASPATSRTSSIFFFSEILNICSLSAVKHYSDISKELKKQQFLILKCTKSPHSFSYLAWNWNLSISSPNMHHFTFSWEIKKEIITQSHKVFLQFFMLAAKLSYHYSSIFKL